ncbi:Phosphatidylinositol-specific phospholipase C, X domain, partial [Sesbania bispinosa]
VWREFRGGGSDQGRESSSQPVDRVRPTTSARQRRSRQQVQETQEDVVPDQAQQEDPAAVQVDMLADVAAPVQPDVHGGGPEDTSILRTFHRYVATQLWNGEDRGTLKVVSHGRKLTTPVDAYIGGIVDNSGLVSLIDCTHSLVDRALLSAFAEKWHRDTCSFYIPVGEMTITLDDVSSLLHLQVTGRLFSLPAIGTEEANMMLRWLRDLYENSVQQGNLDVAAQAYLLHLVGCTIFVDKSGTLVRVGYLELFMDLDMIAWYMTLLQAWIYEHFPHIVSRQPNSSYEEGRPLSKRWAPLPGTGESIFASPNDAFPVSDILDVHYHFLHYQEHLLEEVYRGPMMTIPGECADDYLRWYYRISHPYLIPSIDRVADPVPRRVPRVPIVVSTFDGGLFQGIFERLQAMFARELVTPGTELGVLAQEALDMANLGVEGHRTGRPYYRHVYRQRRDISTQ